MALLVEHDSAYWVGYWFGAIVTLLIMLGIYLLPTLVALKRATQNRTWIIMLDVLAGWTVVGWFGALAWAILDRRTSASAQPQAMGPFLSADGNWWWDGAIWQPTGQQAQGAQPAR